MFDIFNLLKEKNDNCLHSALEQNIKKLGTMKSINKKVVVLERKQSAFLLIEACISLTLFFITVGIMLGLHHSLMTQQKSLLETMEKRNASLRDQKKNTSIFSS